ncbi:MAG TPA: ribosome biogenesis GTP-binding protein YihA/YsxC [Steroidobacteraceae bacterium]
MAAFPNAKFLISAAAAGQYPADQGAEVAFAGRSNAGKSSAINAIVGRQGLARTSKTPGRTRLINFFELAPQRRIVDLPGYGYASAPESERRTWPRLIEALRAREALKGLFVIVDARRGIAEGDEALLAWALPRQRVHVLLSKADKLSRSEGRQALTVAARTLAGRATVQLFSAHAGTGLEEAQGVLRAWLEGKEKTPMTSDEATGAD